MYTVLDILKKTLFLNAFWSARSFVELVHFVQTLKHGPTPFTKRFVKRNVTHNKNKRDKKKTINFDKLSKTDLTNWNLVWIMGNLNCELLVKLKLRTKTFKRKWKESILIYSQIKKQPHTNRILVQIMINPKRWTSFQIPKVNASADLDRSGPLTPHLLSRKCCWIKNVN